MQIKLRQSSTGSLEAVTDVAQCEECGARNAEHATFCVRCGAELIHEGEDAVGESTDTLAPVDEEASMATEGRAATDLDATLVAEPVEATEAVEEAVADTAEDEGGEASALLSEAGQLLSAGDADEAAAKCREAIEVAPDLVAAYSLLGMAEEQRGNTVAAAGAYRRVLQLDPDRKIEREKLETLYAEGGASPHGDDRDRHANSILTLAPWVAAVAAAFFVMMTLTAVGLRVHASNEAERVFTEQMTVAKAALDGEEYHAAAAAFETALAARPEDTEAQRGLRYARRKMASGPSRATGPVSVPQQRSYQASILPSGGPNPFPAIPIGPGRDQPDEAEAVQSQPQQTQTPRTTPPPVMSRDERVEVRRPSPTTTTPGREAMPFEPVEVLDSPAEQQPTSAGDEPSESEPVQEQPRGEITIWRSPRSASQPDTAERPTEQAARTDHADRAYSLRRQAQEAINRGNCEQGKQLLDQAVAAYRADSEANPSKRQANQAAIATCETLRRQCGSGGDQ